ADCVLATYRHSMHAAALKDLDQRYGSKELPFVVHLAPGVGTFEQYVFSGSFNGASADGRRAHGPLGSDLSPAPIPHDMSATTTAEGREEHARRVSLSDSLRSYHSKVMQRFGDGGPVDYNIPEDFPVKDLARIIKRFADGEGGSICTFTVADPQT